MIPVAVAGLLAGLVCLALGVRWERSIREQPTTAAEDWQHLADEVGALRRLLAAERDRLLRPVVEWLARRLDR